jgi:uncharacterized protein YjbI with pentapeptide repeats
MKSIYSILVLSLILFSCKVEQLVQETNQRLSKLESKTDTISNSVKSVKSAIGNYTEYQMDPLIANLQKSSFESFYFGEIINEEIVERRDNWLKVQVTERIRLQNGQVITKNRSAWYSYSNPGEVYLIPTNQQKENEPGLDLDVKQLSAKELSTKELNTKELNAKELSPGIDKNLLTTAGLTSTTKTDLQDQKAIDALLAQKALNFDGLKFTSKRFDYANFSLGSFRGTAFESCDLSFVEAKRGSITSDYDFTETLLSGGSQKRMNFENWKFNETIFLRTAVEKSNFTNCIFAADLNSAGTVHFNSSSFTQSTFSQKENGYFKSMIFNNSTFTQCIFNEVKFYSSINFTTQFVNCIFNGGLWHGVSYNNTQVPPSKIVGGTLNKLVVNGGDYRGIIIEPSGLVKTDIVGVEFVSANFSNSKIDAWFKDSFKAYAFGSFMGTDFKESIFENGVFGSELQAGLFNMKNCDFSKCEFRENVKFVKCDLTGSKWPSNLTNVKFVDCAGKNP